MTTAPYERLSAQDSSFLVFESPQTHMHVGGVVVLEIGSLLSDEGGLDIDRLREYVSSRLRWMPRYRQRLAFTPLGNHPIWVDDAHFNVHYHVRHSALPHPGNEGQLKRMAARILSQQLDRAKPLWELWVVEGLRDGRFALITKTHHCMVDGLGGVDLLSALMTPDPDAVMEEPETWIPRPVPNRLALMRDEVRHRMRVPVQIAQEIRGALRTPERAGADLVDRVTAVVNLARAGLRGAAETPLNRSIGPFRRFDWLALDLAEAKEVKNALGGTVNDVVLATVAGAVGRFLTRRRVNVDVLDFRSAVPVSTRTPHDAQLPGNQVSAWLISLPIQERDPRRRMEKVREMTGNLKQRDEARGAALLMQVGEWAGPGALRLGVQLTAALNPYNLIVTNVPGPPFPLYLLGARMLSGYPQVPLFDRQGLGVALFSYTGQLCWGFNADWDLVPDLADFVADVEASFRELLSAARGEKPVRRLRRVAPARRRAAGARS